MNAVALQMLPLVFADKGFNSAQVATLLSLFFLASLFQPLVGIFAKRNSDILTVRILALLMGVNALFMFFTKQYILMIPLVLLFSVARLSISPVYDSYVTNQTLMHGGNYGLIRSGASLGFGTGMLIYTGFAKLLNASSELSFVFILIISIIAFTLLTTLPSTPSTTTKHHQQLTKQKTNWFKYALLVMLYTLYFGGLGIRITYLSTYYVEFGYTTVFIAITTFIMVIPEVTIMPLYNRLFSNFSKVKLIMISISLGITQILLYIVAHDSAPLLMFTSLFNGLQIMIFFPSYFVLLQDSLGVENSSFGFIINMTVQALFIGIFSLIVIKPIYVHYNSTIPIFMTIIVMMLISYIPLIIYEQKYYKSNQI